MLGVDERRDPAAPLRVGDRVQRNGRLAARLRTVDLDDPATGQATDAEGDIERNGPGGDHLDRRPGLVTETHDRALAVLPLDLRERRCQRLVAVDTCHRAHPSPSGRWTQATLEVRSDTFRRPAPSVDRSGL